MHKFTTHLKRVCTVWPQQFNKDELELIADALRFTIACLTSETTYSFEEMKTVLRKVETLQSEK